MSISPARHAFRFLSAAGALLVLLLAAGNAIAQGDAKRGQYLIKAAGCMGCHTAEKKDAVPFAGGRALKTPFGTFYGPNITTHPTAGIGRWTETDFMRAVRLGERPDGAHYFPAFPYPSFTQMTDADLRDLWAFMRMIPPSAQANQAHDLKFPFGWRFLVAGWKWMFFTPGAYVADAKLTPALNRGAYLTNALAHCGECHTPRNFLGGPNKARLLAGTKTGPDGKGVPNITPGRIKWSEGEFKEFLTGGMNPDGDTPNSTMAEVVTNTTSQLTPADLAAMIAYIRSLPALESEK
jgi:mono/diheme cytochrome c family protein